MVKISIIIPIYNCEEYLEECIKSVFCQTLKELEIICINDGSTDGSVQIVKKFCAEDERVILLHQENQGAGAARNRGIKKAKGKYVAFLDGDDYYLDPEALELMYKECETKGVSICASLRKFLENGREELLELFQDTVKNNILKYEDFQLDYEYQSFLFLRKHLIENEIFFPSYRRFQDPPFLVKALYKAQKFTVVDTYLYCYRVPNVRTRFNRKKAEDLLCGLIDNLLFAQKHNLEILFQNTLFRLEYEYSSIICNNINMDDLKILSLLLKANQIVYEQYRTEDYVIRPLKMLSFYMNPYEKRLLALINETDEIVLYGAGKYGQIFLDYLEQHELLYKVKSFVVSDIKEDKAYVRGIPVNQLKDEKAFIFVTVGRKNQEQIKLFLDKMGYKNYEFVKTEFLELLDCE